MASFPDLQLVTWLHIGGLGLEVLFLSARCGEILDREKISDNSPTNVIVYLFYFASIIWMGVYIYGCYKDKLWAYIGIFVYFAIQYVAYVADCIINIVLVQKYGKNVAFESTRRRNNLGDLLTGDPVNDTTTISGFRIFYATAYFIIQAATAFILKRAQEYYYQEES